MELKPSGTVPISNFNMGVQQYPQETRIGLAYQAVIPELQLQNSDLHDCTELLSQKHNLVTNMELEEYIQKVHHPFYTCNPSRYKVDESSLLITLQHGCDAEETLKKQLNQPEVANTRSLWSEDECMMFESGMNIHWKKFDMIRSHFCKFRSVSELVRFYYFWKRTNRFTAFCKKYKRKRQSISSKLIDLRSMDKENVLASRPFTRYLKKKKFEELLSVNLKQFHHLLSDVICSPTIDNTINPLVLSSETSCASHKEDLKRGRVSEKSTCFLESDSTCLNESPAEVELKSLHSTGFMVQKHTASNNLECAHNSLFEECKGCTVIKSKQRKLISC